ncbi:hypothetical protein [Lactococcus lactis]|uniref:hypothetical protein n=1 Tax=Lactococcus lactis TaxID=1358 RepID=UPI00345DE6AF
MNINTSLTDKAEVGLGESSSGFLGGVYTNKPTFSQSLKSGKLEYQSINFSGNIKMNGKDFYDYSQSYSFHAYADTQIPLKSNNKIIAYANGFIGSNDGNKITYLINISNTKNKIELDPLYSNNDIKTFTTNN